MASGRGEAGSSRQKGKKRGNADKRDDQEDKRTRQDTSNQGAKQGTSQGSSQHGGERRGHDAAVVGGSYDEALAEACPEVAQFLTGLPESLRKTVTSGQNYILRCALQRRMKGSKMFVNAERKQVEMVHLPLEDGKTNDAAGLSKQIEYYINDLRISSSADHRNILKFQNLVIFGDDIYTEFEFGKTSLFDLRIFPRPHEAITKSLMRDLGNGLRYLHETLQVVHRDIRPKNLIVVNGVLKIYNFQSATKPGVNQSFPHFRDSICYYPPEVMAKLDDHPTFAIDVWSTACILLGMFGKPLVTGHTVGEQTLAIGNLLGTKALKDWTLAMNKPEVVAAFGLDRDSHPPKLDQRLSALPVLAKLTAQEMLTFNPEQRISIVKFLESTWFTHQPAPASEADVNKFFQPK